METQLQEEVNKILKSFPEYWNESTLLRNKLIEDIRSYKKEIIEALLSNNLIRDTYTLQLQSGSIFKIEDFISMLRFKNYWDNSYTKYTNEIGLTSEGKYLKYNTDVVLDFPHKDSVLEGGMTKEDIGKKEIYYNNVIAKEEIDVLLSPKVLINMKRYDTKGTQEHTHIDENDNLVIKGNNLIALHSLKEKFAEKVKLIYIDPPYNTGKDSFKYNDRFNRSTWLTFMKNRLEVARDFLSNDGLIMVHIDQREQAYLKVLMDDIFNEDNYLATLVWENKEGGGKSDSEFFRLKHEYILVYAKNINHTVINGVSVGNENRYKLTDEYYEVRGPYYLQKLGMGSLTYSASLDYGIEAPDGTIVYPKDNNNGSRAIWRWSKEKLQWGIENDFIVIKQNKDGIWTYYTKQYLKVDNEGKPIDRSIQPLGKITEIPSSNDNHKKALSDSIEKYSTTQSSKHMRDLFGKTVFKYTKPEGLISYLIGIASSENDIVFDFFMGSATTQAVAHKMNRQYIGIEQMDYINTVSVPRLQRVIKGEQGGISKDVEWQDGGSFVYAELYSLNEEFVDKIHAIGESNDLNNLLQEMKDKAYLNFKVDLEKMTSDNSGFFELSLQEQKDILIQGLDMNQLYLNYSEIEDSHYEIPDSVKAFNYSFYQKEGDTDE